MAKKRTDLVKSDEVIINKIYFLRGEKVMLDKDLAELYGVVTIRMRQQVKRNLSRFPKKFMFQLTQKEVDMMVSQNVIPSKSYLGGYLPYVFTEHGVLMLANVLKSERAVQMSVRIIEVFVKMREILLAHKDIMLKLEKLEKEVVGNTEDIKVIFEYLKELLAPDPEPRTRIGYKIKEG